MGKKKTRIRTNNNDFKLSEIINDLTYNDYFNRLKTIAVSRFEWENLPNSCDEDFLEESLFEYGKATFLYDDNGNIINSDCTDNGTINIYNKSMKWNCSSPNGQNLFRDLYFGQDIINDNMCVLVKNKKNMLPTFSTLQLFAYRLYIAERTIDINAHALRTPFLISCDEKYKLTVENLYNDYNGFKPKIIGRKKALEDIEVNVLKTDAPFLLDKFEDYKDKIWNEALTYLGVNNIIKEKKERLISNEAEQNNELINLNLDSFLAPRKEACKQFNELFSPEKKLNVKVRSDLENIIKTQLSTYTPYRNEVEEVEENE